MMLQGRGRRLSSRPRNTGLTSTPFGVGGGPTRWSKRAIIVIVIIVPAAWTGDYRSRTGVFTEDARGRVDETERPGHCDVDVREVGSKWGLTYMPGDLWAVADGAKEVKP